MSDIDAGFMEVLESCAGAEGEVDYSDDGWKPSDGEYTVLLEKFTCRTKEKNGIANGMGNAIFRILSGDFAGKSFSEFFWLPSNAKQTSPGMSNLLRLATCICEREFKVSEIGEAGQQISDNCGSAVLSVRVFSTTRQSDGKVFVNTRFLTLVDENTAQEAVQEEEPATA